MSELPKRIYLREVGPREGFQFEKGPISTDDKLRLIDALSETGLPQIQVTSFVSPKAVPQMADAEEIARRFVRKPGVRYDALYLNEKGFERAWATGRFDFEGQLGTVASDTFCRRNQNRSIPDLLADLPARIQQFEQHQIPVNVIGMMAAFGCNYEGDVALSRVLELVAAARNAAADRGHTIERVHLSDTMGWANPLQIKRTVAAVRERWPEYRVSLHLHDTRGTGLANVLAAWEVGVDYLDSAVAGLGGCPFAGHKEAAGNVCTEDIVFMAHEMGIETGVDLERMIECSRLAEAVVGHPLPGKVAKGGSLAKHRSPAQAV